MRIALFITCLTDGFYPRAAVAITRVLEHLGHEVVCPLRQTCCGQPMVNAGDHASARKLARRLIEVFEPFETIVTPSGSCGSTVRERYADLFAEGSADHVAATALAARTFEFTELLRRLDVDPKRLGNWEGPLTYHFACHGRDLGLREPTETLLRRLPGVEYRPLDKIEQCCGFGGVFSTRYGEVSGELVRDKVGCLEATGVDTVVCNDAGCTMNIAGGCRRAGVPMRFVSIAEIMAEGLGLLDRPGDDRARPRPATAPPPPSAPSPAKPEGHLLDPPLPFDMRPRMQQATRDVQLQQFVNSATRLKDDGRVDTCRSAFGDHYDDLRRRAGAIKQHTLDHLDQYLERFIDQAAARGTTVHFAADAEQARRICLEIAEQHSCRLCVKSKSMVTEEIHLLPAFEAAGIETVETDLGEFIIQLDDDAPSHIVTPMIHKDRRSVGEAFTRELGADYTDDPEALTLIAREHLRAKYRAADLGMSGANFLIADTGAIVVCTNEGNADLAMSGPPVHVAVVGLEKLIPSLHQLPVFLKLLARSATAQAITVYTSIIAGPRRPEDRDGPEAMHIVIVDNGRTNLLGAESRELLRCIRCGACLNACPVYRKVGGGHAYGAVYSGPIGAVITPLLKGLENYPDLPHASSLCGACHEACPVDIDIPSHLIRLRARMRERKLNGRMDRLVYRVWARCLERPWLYGLSSRLTRTAPRMTARTDAGAGGLEDRGWIKKVPGPLAGWTDHRDLPTPTSLSFREWWQRRKQEEP